MTSGIGGSGPIGAPRGPAGADGIGGAGGVDGPGEALSLGGASGATGVDQLATDIRAGRISADEALAQLVAEAIPGGLDGVAGLDRADLQAVLDDLIATDPYLSSLAARLGATPRDDG
jgi:hypothetical protein